MKITTSTMFRSARILMAGLCMTVAASAVQASDPITVLEGSDATGFHHDAAYTSQLFTYLREGSSLPVLVFGSVSIRRLTAITHVYQGRKLEPGYA